MLLNSWHGTPLKKMGFDIDDQPARVANVLRTFLHTDHLLSSSPYTTETLYRRAQRLTGLYDGQVLETGSPRIDHRFAETGTLDIIRAEMIAAGIDSQGRELVLFAPT